MNTRIYSEWFDYSIKPTKWQKSKQNSKLPKKKCVKQYTQMKLDESERKRERKKEEATVMTTEATTTTTTTTK